MNDSLLEKTQARFCSASYKKCVGKIWSQSFLPFWYWSSWKVDHQEIFSQQIPLTIKVRLHAPATASDEIAILEKLMGIGYALVYKKHLIKGLSKNKCSEDLSDIKNTLFKQ